MFNIDGLWRWNNGATAVSALDGQANITGGRTAEAANATATWNAQPNSTISYTIGPSGVNPIHLNALFSPCGWNTCMAGGGVMGCGGPRGRGLISWRGETYATITSGEVWLRAHCTFNLWDSITTQSVLTHELGHTLGLGHSDAGASPHDVCRGDEDAAQMRSFVQHRTTLGTDDEDAVRWIYGDAGNSCTVSGPTLSVTKTGTGTGTVTSLPAGISCGTTCFAAFANGAVVTLSAGPRANSVFTGWSGDADCADSSVTMNASKTCTAHFDPDFLTFTDVPRNHSSSASSRQCSMQGLRLDVRRLRRYTAQTPASTGTKWRSSCCGASMERATSRHPRQGQCSRTCR